MSRANHPFFLPRGALKHPLLASCLLAAALAFGAATSALAQGCVASPNNPVSPFLPGECAEGGSMAGRWFGTVDFRWYESGRHFVGDVKQPQREQLGNNVINHVYLFDVAATYGLNDRWSASLTIPFLYADRSSLYEHDFVHRHTMHSGGLGDIQVTTDFWLLDPPAHMEGNLALGVGFRAPTGDAQAADMAYRSAADGGPTLRPVDPSVQPGSGGWGIVLELQAYQKILPGLYGYLQGSYNLTPEEQNDTQFTLADVPRFATLLTPLRTQNSIPDQYFGRGGFSYLIWPKHGLTLLLGGRVEGVPAHDAIGGSMGFRRPGYTVSVEPGISWSGKNNSLSLLAPVAVYRNRVRSAPEEALGAPGGDAAFADFSILASFTHRF
jgi:hypothetical protein